MLSLMSSVPNSLPNFPILVAVGKPEPEADGVELWVLPKPKGEGASLVAAPT